MTEEQRQLALSLCDRILQTAAKLHADLEATAKVIKEGGEVCSSSPRDRKKSS